MARIKKEEDYKRAKENLENALMDLFYTKKLEDIKIKDICEKAGVGIGTFYHYYKNKEQILVERFTHVDKIFLNQVRPNLENLDFIQGIFGYLEAYANIGELRSVDYMRQVYKSYLTNNEDMVEFKNREIYMLLQDIFNKAFEDGVLREDINYIKASEYFFMCLKGFTFNWCTYGDSFNVKEEIMGFAKMYLLGIVKDEYRNEVVNYEVKI